ncbi:MAG TPA: glycosyltransferase [Gemmatimonadales bacterium]|nr:glycosyltransferase [Gemmatimonadales bacterium]
MFTTERLQDLAIEGVLRVWPEATDRAAPSYTLPPDIARRVSVRWPRTYEWGPADVWGDQYRRALSRHVPVRVTDVPQRFKGNIVCHVAVDGRTYAVAFDYNDNPLVLDEESVRRNLVTFKAQYSSLGYGQPEVLPGGYVFGNELPYRMLPYLRWLRRTRSKLFDVYGRFGAKFGTNIRAPALKRLNEAQGFQFEGGLQMVGYSRYLREVARSLVVVDLPGNGPLCFRLVEYLAIGACVVAYPHHAAMPMPLVHGEHLLYVREDLSDLEEQCERCLADQNLRVRLGGQAADYFDRYLHRDQLGAYFIASVLDRIASCSPLTAR